MASTWIAYNDLAWTEAWLADPDDYEKEAHVYVRLIMDHAAVAPRTMLHLGCGAGGLDRVFKRYFSVTGVDVSAGMLTMARARHPDITYIEDDMRSLRLSERFDVVVIPDSIDYMASLDDLNKAIGTAAQHLQPGGVLLVVGKTAETFQNNNFAYVGEKDGIHITLLENNHVDPRRPNSYEAILVYLIRRYGELSVHTDQHRLGLFAQADWERLFRGHGLRLTQKQFAGLYDPYLLADGTYPLQIFLCRKFS